MRAKQSAFLTAFILVCLLTLQARADLRGSVVAAWLMDEGQGAVAADSAGNHDGDLVGDVSWNADGKFGAALDFSGEPFSYVEVPHEDDLTLDTWTVTAWVKLQPPIASPGGWTIVLVKDPADGLQNYALDMSPQGNVVAEATDGGGVEQLRFHHVGA